MNATNLREGMITAILLAGVATSTHSVEIPNLGMVYIKPGAVGLITPQGIKTLTRANLEIRLQEMLGQDENERLKAQLQHMVAA